MPTPPHMPAALRRRIFRARDVLHEGLLTRAQLRGPAWQRVVRGVYADARLTLDHDLKTRATALALPRDAAITGVSAAWQWGARLATASDPVDVVTPPGRRLGVTAQLRVRTSPLPPDDVDELSGIRLTTPVRTAWELAQRLDLADAVAYCDVLAGLGRLDSAALCGYVGARVGRHGYRRARHLVGHVDGRAESPQESRLRVHLALAGLPAPVPQYEVRVAGEFLARVDFAWPEVKVAVEYDGVWHADARQLVQDRGRLNRLLAAGWHVHHVTVRDLTRIDATVQAIAQALRTRNLTW